MRQNDIGLNPGSRHRRKRIGRGVGSGHGTYSCKGCKGQKARSGGGVSPWFEGGQNPLVKRLPTRRGFTNIFKVEYSLVNLRQLGIFEKDTEVTPEKLVEAGIVPSLKKPIKILGDGDIKHPLVVKSNAFSLSAVRKIESSGGRAEKI